MVVEGLVRNGDKVDLQIFHFDPSHHRVAPSGLLDFAK